MLLSIKTSSALIQALISKSKMPHSNTIFFCDCLEKLALRLPFKSIGFVPFYDNLLFAVLIDAQDGFRNLCIVNQDFQELMS